MTTTMLFNSFDIIFLLLVIFVVIFAGCFLFYRERMKINAALKRLEGSKPQKANKQHSSSDPMGCPMIYVAGKFRGKTAWEVENNIRQAEKHGLQILKRLDQSDLAVPVIIPHTLYRFFDKEIEDGFVLDLTLNLLENCSYLFLCPDWENSTGARAEKEFAVKQGIPVFTDIEMLLKHVQEQVEAVKEQPEEITYVTDEVNDL